MMRIKKIAAFVAASALTLSAVPKAAALDEPVVDRATNPTIIFGDVNTNDIVNGADVLELIKFFLNRTTTLLDSSFSFTNADLNFSGQIELTDLATLKQYVVGDTVSMNGKAFNAFTQKSEGKQLVNVKKKYIISGLQPLMDEQGFFLETYNDACERFEELNLSYVHMDILNKINIQGSSTYTTEKEADAILVLPLNNTSIRSPYFVHEDTSFDQFMDDSGELWVSEKGYEFYDEPGDESSVLILVMEQKQLEKIYLKLGVNAFTQHVPIYHNDTLISQMPAPLKPVIYLYPEEETDVHVELDFNGRLTHTYPKYSENGWDVTAQPDGTLTDKDGYEYSYLFWDGISNKSYDMSKGFVVKGEDTASFLREKLSYMGLTPREYNEFIVYWMPQMENNKYNLITFQQEEYTENAKLNITPEPDSMLRVFMTYKALDEYADVPEQDLPTFERKGFSVVEWGGAVIK